MSFLSYKIIRYHLCSCNNNILIPAFNKFKITLSSFIAIHHSMSKSMTPEEFLDLQVEEFNRGNISFLMTLYENDACFASKPGQVVKDPDSIRQTLQSFIDMGCKLEAKAKRVLQANNLALLITEWSINGNGPNGKPVNHTGRGTVVLLRQKSDDTWRILIENPWGTD